MKKKVKSIYDLELHESINIPHCFEVTRVPSGWIYRFWDYGKQDYPTMGVFVPYDNKFQTK